MLISKVVRFGATTAVIALVLAVAPIAGATDSSQSGQTSGGGANVLTIYLQMQQLKQRIRNMQGEIETLQHRLAQTRKLEKKNYQSLAQKVTGQSSTNGGSASNNSSGGGGSQQSSTTKQAKSSSSGGHTHQTSAGEKHQNQSENAIHQQYMAAFNTLKNGNYDKAASAFETFVTKHPHNGLTDNAYYWRGEALYVQQHYENAKKSFEKLVNNFPKSPKLPDALYKIGLIQIHDGHQDNAKSTLDRVIKNYGESRAANLARKKRKQLGS